MNMEEFPELIGNIKFNQLNFFGNIFFAKITFAESIIIHRIIKAEFGSKYDNIRFIRVIYKAVQAKMIDLVVAIDFQFVSFINS